MTDWLPVLIMFIVAVGFALASLGASYLLSPKKATPEKLAPYECGTVSYTHLTLPTNGCV